ncbi:PQQ-dependent sugar dehydrogenase [Paenibacillus macquariensis]|uniref:Glucose/arabinose dehydrogenase, beta-propeller fold n=1 Tax=Paenibacillus macquariensis TaxID=948756 RepID=A0ABY1KEK0_9BACL|nr:PQQ-dependent sugar dehydrogenase [Paenibacillus macquariensis]MEC0093173.1 PQQ-dependent sugar dehydrogenase [Paenibacillus macquariensis]OAB27807.1 cellulose 1,4-beta-cellobiosidase [Paenibacillus macquariensis subsp. macquariensis]SIR71762.1 Glucose/arabinose dehydrogenase, beta-propeller fold [Paenibacillus macquariensis]
MIKPFKIMGLCLSICLLFTVLPAHGSAEVSEVSDVNEVTNVTEVADVATDAAPVAAVALPNPWKQQIIGSPAITGTSSYDPSNDKFTVSGAGTDIWGKTDQLNYVYQPWTGDGSIIALISSQTNPHDFAKAGVMIRETLNADSKHVDLLLTPANGFTFQYRTDTGGTSQSVKIASTSPYWVKLERKGNVIKGYVSNNGLNWGDLGNVTLSMNASLYVGLAVTSHNVSNLSTATFDKVKVNATGDVFPPTEPTNLLANSVTSTTANISWTASLDDVGVKDYDVYKDNVLTQANVTSTTYTFSGLTPSTTYNFTVKAKDTAGNVSNASSPLTVTTTGQIDTQAPTTPTALVSSSKTSSSVNLAWTASTDNVSVYAYDIYRNGTLAGSTPTTSFNVTGLTANTSYSFTVKARDLAGNISAASTALSVKTNTTSSDPYTPEVVASNLETPWAIALAPDGRIFFTERNSGRIRVVVNGQLKSTPVMTLPSPFYYMPKSEGGLLGLALDPNFATNHYMYIYHSYKTSDNKVANQVVRLKENNNVATQDKVLITNLPGAVYHNGGRVKIGPDNKLYFSDGNYGNTDDTLNYLGGKMFRLNLDGTIPSDNPFGASSPIYSRGHRNPQGIAWQPGTNRLFISEHGESSKDEINFVQPGNNYGWPKYEGSNQNQPGITPPLIYANGTTWAPSGMTFVTQGPWAGNLLVTNLKGKQIIRMVVTEQNGKPTIDSNNLTYLFLNKYGRIRDIVEAPDGSLYFVTSNNGDKNGDGTADKLVRLVPNF